jgi:hypothetical protein
MLNHAILMPKLGGSDWLIKLRSMGDLMEGVNDDARSYIPRVLLISCLDAMCGFKEGGW